MKDNLRRLQWILKLLKYNSNIYTASCSSDINIQGYFHPSLTTTLIKLRFTQCIDINGYLSFTRGYYTVTLTEKG